MSAIRTAFLALGWLALTGCGGTVAEDGVKRTITNRGTFTITPETTWATEPLDPDGYVDYAAALNKRLREGVTPDTNANVLLWKAFGPRPEGGRGMPPEFFEEMGIAEPPEKGDYFIDLRRYVREQHPNDQENK